MKTVVGTQFIYKVKMEEVNPRKGRAVRIVPTWQVLSPCKF